MSGDEGRPERRGRDRLMGGGDEPRLERVVVGLDFQPSSLEALRWTRAVLAPRAELVVVNVSPDPDHDPDADSDAIDERLHAIVDSVVPPAARGVARAGDPPAVVAAVAEESGADVIVVGTRGPGAPASSRLGSTAERLIRISPVPVLLAAGGAPRPTRILVPVDESELTSPVLAWTAFLAATWGASVTLLHVVDPDAATTAAATGAPADDAASWLARLAGELQRPGSVPPGAPGPGKVATMVSAGRPGEAVLAAAAEHGAELVVMGRRGAGRIFSGLMGSTASTVLRGADCPVLVVVDPPFAIVDAW